MGLVHCTHMQACLGSVTLCFLARALSLVPLEVFVMNVTIQPAAHGVYRKEWTEISTLGFLPHMALKVRVVEYFNSKTSNQISSTDNMHELPKPRYLNRAVLPLTVNLFQGTDVDRAIMCS